MSDLTRIVSQIESGDPAAAEQLLPLVYDELLRGHTSWVQGVDFSPDGQWIASASLDGTVKVWEAPPEPPPLRRATAAEPDQVDVHAGHALSPRRHEWSCQFSTSCDNVTVKVNKVVWFFLPSFFETSLMLMRGSSSTASARRARPSLST